MKKKNESEKALDEFFKQYVEQKREEGITGLALGADFNEMFKGLQKRFYEAALEGEMEHHLGYKKGQKPEDSDNLRNGTSTKKVITDKGEVELKVPRDRAGDFEPELIPKYQRRLPGFDEKVLYFYGMGMSQRDIATQLKDLYHTEVSQELISKVTDSINDDVVAWRNRPLDEVYPIVYLDALVTKMQSDGTLSNHAVYLALGVNLEGHKEVLGLWISRNEGSKFWMNVLTEMQNRGLQDILIACVDGLSGFSEAINSVYPRAEVQSCIVHAVRNSLKFVGWKERKKVAADLKLIYQSPTKEAAEAELKKFKKKWDGVHPIISQQWERNWEKLSVLYKYPSEIRKAIYTTNAVESLNHSLRKVLKNKKSFPTEEALYKVLYLAVGRASERWTMPIQNWGVALARFKIEFGDRLPDISKIDI